MAADIGSVVGMALSSVGAVGASVRYLDRREIAAFGLRLDREWSLNLVVGTGIGFAIPAVVLGSYLATGAASIEGVLTAETTYPFFVVFGVGLILMIGISVAEELLVRGYVMRTLADGFRRFPRIVVVLAAWIVSAALFAWFHSSRIDLWYEAAHFWAAGLLLGLPVVLRGELGMAIGIHFAYNVGMEFVFGLREGPAILTLEMSESNEWIGLAGIAETTAVVAAMIPVLFWFRWRSGRLSTALYVSSESRPDRGHS